MTDIKVFENVAVATFIEIPIKDDNCAMFDIFSNIGNAGINIDMISQEISVNDTVNAGFTFADEDLSKLLSTIKNISAIPAPLISCGNVKFIVKSSDMIGTAGFAAKVLNALKEVGCLPLLITTGLDEISILVRDTNSADVAKKLQVLFA